MLLRFTLILAAVIPAIESVAQSPHKSIAAGIGYPIPAGYNHLAGGYQPGITVLATGQIPIGDKWRIGGLYEHSDFYNSILDRDQRGYPVLISTARAQLHSLDAFMVKSFPGKSRFQFNVLLGAGLSVISYDEKDLFIETPQHGINIMLKPLFDYPLTTRLHSSLAVGYQFAYFFSAPSETPLHDKHTQLITPQFDLSYWF